MGFAKNNNSKPFLEDVGEIIDFFIDAHFQTSFFYKKEENKPYVLQQNFLPIIVKPYPFIMPTKREGQVVQVNTLSPLSVWSEPVPYGLFMKKDSEIPFLIKGTLKVFSEPYPYGLFLKEKRLYIPINDIINFGAFKDCTSLESIEIPQSVKYIGPNAFENTALTQVVLASDCKYYSTSFPVNCEICDINGNPVEPIDRGQL